MLDFPPTNIQLETKDGTAYHQKTDIFGRVMWYSFDRSSNVNSIQVPVERVKEIIKQNKKGIKVDKLIENIEIADGQSINNELGFQNVVGQDSLNRFDIQKTRKRKRKPKRRSRNRDN